MLTGLPSRVVRQITTTPCVPSGERVLHSAAGNYEPTTELLMRLPEIAKAQWAVRRDRITGQRRQLSVRQAENDGLNRTAITAKLKGELSPEDFATMKDP